MLKLAVGALALSLGLILICTVCLCVCRKSRQKKKEALQRFAENETPTDLEGTGDQKLSGQAYRSVAHTSIVSNSGENAPVKIVPQASELEVQPPNSKRDTQENENPFEVNFANDDDIEKKRSAHHQVVSQELADKLNHTDNVFQHDASHNIVTHEAPAPE